MDDFIFDLQRFANVLKISTTSENNGKLVSVSDDGTETELKEGTIQNNDGTANNNAYILPAGDYEVEGTITLDKSIGVTAAVTLDLKGGTISYVGGTAIRIGEGGNLTVKDSAGTGKITGNCGITLWPKAENTTSTLTFESGTIEATSIGISGNGGTNLKGTTSITINGGTIKATGTHNNLATKPDDASLAIYHPQKGMLTINGGGKIIFDDVASTTKFNINGLSYNISGSKLVKK